MADEKIIKNGLVLTLDNNDSCGYFDIIIRDDTIIELITAEATRDEFIKERFPAAEIVDASGKIILPGFINPNLNSSFLLGKPYLRKSYYDSIHDVISLQLLEKYFQNPRCEQDLFQLLSLSYTTMLLNGCTTVVEVSRYLYRDFIKRNFEDNSIFKQKLIFTSYQFYLSTYFKYKNQFYLSGFKLDEELNNYSINSIKKNLNPGENKLYLEILSGETFNKETRRAFGKSLVKVFNEFNLLSGDMIFSNPASVDPDDIDLLGKNKVNVVFNPTDFVKLSRKNIEFELLTDSGANLSIGTGYLGKDILSEMRSYAKLIYKSKFSYSDILKMGCKNPAKIVCEENIKGSITRNKKADLIFFDMKDVRNVLNVPEIHHETLSEFVIENLTSKDITNVFIGGEEVYCDKKISMINLDNLSKNASELIGKIYAIGNYQQFKEQHYMRKRVDDLMKKPVDSSSFRSEIHSGQDIFDNDLESDFRVVGIRGAEIFETDIEGNGNSVNTAREMIRIDTFEDGFVIPVKEVKRKKMVFDDFSATVSVEDEPKPVDEIIILENDPPGSYKQSKQEIKKVKPESPKDVTFKKTKLRFGFTDDSEAE